MSSSGKRKARLAESLDSHVRNIEETFQMLDNSAASSLEKMDWSKVLVIGAEVSKQATIVGMLRSEELEIQHVQESIDAYFNALHGFVLLCHGCTAGAGGTLHASIVTSARQVVYCSIALLKEAVFTESSNSSRRVSSIPQLSGSVWEACANLKKTPTSNSMAIGRAITQVAVLLQDVLREMNELKPAALAASTAASHDDDDDSDDINFETDLSLEEMLIAQLAIKVASDVLLVLKEAIRFVSSLHRRPNSETTENVKVLERLLNCCRELGNDSNELGAALYSPQEITMLKSAVKKIHVVIDEIRKVDIVGSSRESLLTSIDELEASLKKLGTGLHHNNI